MAKKRRRRIHSVQDLVWDMADDVKDLVRNEFESKGKEKDRPATARARSGEKDRDSARRAAEMDELRDAIHGLAVKITALAADQENPAEQGKPTEQGRPAE